MGLMGLMRRIVSLSILDDGSENRKLLTYSHSIVLGGLLETS